MKRTLSLASGTAIHFCRSDCSWNVKYWVTDSNRVRQSSISRPIFRHKQLLRVLQTRTFSRVGETKPHRFLGKFVTATNRDLAAEISQGHFREELYYRLCADMVRTPTLQEQLMDRPEDLLELTRFIARRLLVELPDEADSLASRIGWASTGEP